MGAQCIPDAYIGEIRMFGGNFPPLGWAFCNGQLLTINEYAELASLVGTIYGGDGRTSFGLPDLRGRVPVHMGQGPGLNNYSIGLRSGLQQVTLTTNEIPIHNHPMVGSTNPGTTFNVREAIISQPTANIYVTSVGDSNTVMTMNELGINSEGEGQPHNNEQPCVAVSFIIALFGIYPTRP